jgi:predicted AlkP superfamily pyrophosphatase or phosphodiesterase
VDYLVPTYHPDVAVLWITEPDHAQHGHGPGSPEAVAALAALDTQLQALVEALERTGGPHTYLLASDHGFSTISPRVDIDARLVAAGLKETPEETSILYDCDSFYLNGPGAGRYDDLIRFLAGEPWVGALLVRDDLMANYPNAMPQSAVLGNHYRSAELMFAYRWSPAENEHGVPGCSASYSSIAATHGSASPFDVRSSLVAWGTGIKRGIISSVPCGNVDVAPTVLHLLGLPSAPSMQGRILTELLVEGPDLAEVESSQITREAGYQSDDGPRRQTAHYSAAQGYCYLDQITWEE